MCIDFGIFVYKISSMKIHIEIDDGLMNKALKYSKSKSKKKL